MNKLTTERFYPKIDKYPAIKELVAEAFDEHAEFEQTLQQISELPTDKADWLEMIKELEEVVQEHVYKEEDKMFPAARKELDESRAEELGRQILEMKREKSPDRALASTRTMMKALVYQAPGKKQLEERPIPQIEAPTDAVVKIVKTTSLLPLCRQLGSRSLSPGASTVLAHQADTNPQRFALDSSLEQAGFEL